MQKQAPSFWRITAMVVFALSCFGILTFLWVSFGGSVPLKPKNYEVRIDFPEATTLAEQADVRISGVPVGKTGSRTPPSPTPGKPALPPKSANGGNG